MNKSQAKKYLQSHTNAQIYVIPSLVKYQIHIRDENEEQIVQNEDGRPLGYESLESINKLVNKWGRSQYQLVHNDPHGEMGGLDNDDTPRKVREHTHTVYVKE